MGREKRALSLGLSGILLLCSSAAVRAQYEETRSVHGKVVDSAGEPLSQAVVFIEDTQTLTVRSYITKRDGGYVFHGLSTNVTYDLNAKWRSKKSGTKHLSQFNSRPNAEINLEIPNG